MKKTILTILVCGVIVLGITGCGKDKEKKMIMIQSLIFIYLNMIVIMT